jgi:hypothetical protein
MRKCICGGENYINQGESIIRCFSCERTLLISTCPETGHEYAEKICPHCGQDFCWSCCGSTNVDQGGKHAPDYMICPNCGHDYYQEN